METSAKLSAGPLGKFIQNVLRPIESITLAPHIARVLEVSTSEVGKWRERLIKSDRLPQILTERWSLLTGSKLSAYSGGVTVGGANEALYYFIRALRPKFVVETGVASGFSTSYILQGLEDNQLGELHSVDNPNTDPRGYRTESGGWDTVHVRTREEVGMVVPQNLRRRWHLHLGTSRDILPKLLSQLGVIDIFWHDSDHSRSNMFAEFSSAWPHLSEGGLLLADDAVQNTAFRDFCSDATVPTFSWYSRCGARKPRSQSQ